MKEEDSGNNFQESAISYELRLKKKYDFANKNHPLFNPSGSLNDHLEKLRFHERTRLQASKDKRRDRILQSTGFLVFRYSGSDIWKDVFACAEQAFQTLIEVTHKEAERLSNA